MRKISIVVIIAIWLMFGGCRRIVNTDTEKAVQTQSLGKAINTNGLSDWIDPESGVHYWVYRGYNKISMAPRYNPDGTLMIGEVNK